VAETSFHYIHSLKCTFKNIPGARTERSKPKPNPLRPKVFEFGSQITYQYILALELNGRFTTVFLLDPVWLISVQSKKALTQKFPSCNTCKN